MGQHPVFVIFRRFAVVIFIAGTISCGVVHPFGWKVIKVHGHSWWWWSRLHFISGQLVVDKSNKCQNECCLIMISLQRARQCLFLNFCLIYSPLFSGKSNLHHNGHNFESKINIGFGVLFFLLRWTNYREETQAGSLIWVYMDCIKLLLCSEPMRGILHILLLLSWMQHQQICGMLLSVS